MYGSAHTTRSLDGQRNRVQPLTEHSSLDFIGWRNDIATLLAQGFVRDAHPPNGHDCKFPKSQGSRLISKSFWTETATEEKVKRAATNYDLVIGQYVPLRLCLTSSIVITTSDTPSSASGATVISTITTTASITPTSNPGDVSNSNVGNSSTTTIISPLSNVQTFVTTLTSSTGIPLTTPSPRYHDAGAVIAGLVIGVICISLILLAIVVYFRRRKRSKSTKEAERIVTGTRDRPSGRLHPENEPVDGGRLGAETNEEAKPALPVTREVPSEEDDQGGRLMRDDGSLDEGLSQING